MNKYRRLLVFVSLILLVAVMVPNALAYFSTYTQTSGKKIITVGDESQIEEKDVKNGIKTIEISADDGSSPIFIRVKAIHIEGITTAMSATPTLDYNLEKWSKSGDYYYFADPLDGFADTDFVKSATLDLTVSIPADLKESVGEEVHVVVVYEAIPAAAEKNDPSLWTNVQIVGGNS